MNVVFNNTLNITKFYYQFQQQKVYSIKVDKMFNLIFYAHKRMLKCFLFWFYLKNFPTMITKDNICNMWLVGFDIDSFVSIIKTFTNTNTFLPYPEYRGLILHIFHPWDYSCWPGCVVWPGWLSYIKISINLFSSMTFGGQNCMDGAGMPNNRVQDDDMKINHGHK